MNTTNKTTKQLLIDAIRAKSWVYIDDPIFEDYDYYSSEMQLIDNQEELEHIYSQTTASKYISWNDINFKIDNWSFEYYVSVDIEMQDNFDDLIDKLYQYALDNKVTNKKALAILKKISSKPYVMGDWYIQSRGISGFGEYSVLMCRYCYGFVDYICKALDPVTANCLMDIYSDFLNELQAELKTIITARMKNIDNYFHSPDRYVDIIECLDLEEDRLQDLLNNLKN